MAFSPWILTVFLVYFAALIGIAVARVRGMQEMSDYVLGGRRIGIITSALSTGASTSSGWTMLVLPALAFQGGLIQVWLIVCIVFGLWLNWQIVAKRLRRFTIAAEDSLTLPEFFERRFNDRTGVLRTITAFVTVFFVIFYVSSGMIAGSKLLNTIFGLDETVGILLTFIRRRLLYVHRRFLGGLQDRRISGHLDGGQLHRHGGHAVLHHGQPLPDHGSSLRRFLEPADGRRRGADRSFLPALGRRLGVRRVRISADIAALHGGGERSEDTGQS